MSKLINLAFIAVATLTLTACDGGEKKQEQASMEEGDSSLSSDCSFDSAASSEAFDIAILNGRVMDPECKFDDVRNVGIKDGKIVSITKQKINATDTVDATGHVVTAGFIDTHTHSSDKFVIKMAMMDGVTTGMDYELGGVNIAAWYDREVGKWPINYGQCVAHEMVRINVHDGIDLPNPVDPVDAFKLRAESAKDGVEGWSVTVSNLDQINQITKRLD